MKNKIGLKSGAGRKKNEGKGGSDEKIRLKMDKRVYKLKKDRFLAFSET